MSIGAPSLATNQRTIPIPAPGPPFVPTSAVNGLSVDPVSGAIVLGNNVGLTSAALLSNRFIPMGAFSLDMQAGSAAASRWDYLFNSETGFMVVSNDETTVAPLTRTGYRVRNVPGAAAGFNHPFSFSSSLSNTGTVMFEAFDEQAPATGGTQFLFRLRDTGGTSDVMQILNSGFVYVQQQLGVGTAGALSAARISSLADSNAVTTGLTVKNGDAGVNSAIQVLFENNAAQAIMRLNGNTMAVEPNTFFLDNSATNGDILFTSGTAGLRVHHNNGVEINGGTGTNGVLDVNGPLNTTAPSGGVSASGDIQFGSMVVAASAIDPNRYWEINVNGTVIKVCVAL